MERIIQCPNCGKVLDEDDYDMTSAYHNTFDCKCKLCGYTNRLMIFTYYK